MHCKFSIILSSYIEDFGVNFFFSSNDNNAKPHRDMYGVKYSCPTLSHSASAQCGALMEKDESCFVRNVLVLIDDDNLSGPWSTFQPESG